MTLRTGTRRDYRKLAGLKTRKRKTMNITRKVRVKEMSAPAKASVTDLVNRLVHKGRENKFKGYNVLVSNITPAITQAHVILPNLDKGTEDFQRIGDKVQPKSLVLRGQLSIDHDTNVMSDTVHVRLLVLRVREAQRNTLALTQFIAKSNTLLNPNYAVGSSLNGYTGNPINDLQDINTDAFRVLKDRIYELNPAFYVAGQSQPSNFGSVRRISLSIPLPASLMYSDDSNEAQNYAPVLAIGYCYPDGRLLEAGEQRVNARFFSKLVYEDA